MKRQRGMKEKGRKLAENELNNQRKNKVKELGKKGKKR